jgi:hypothetical protein
MEDKQYDIYTSGGKLVRSVRGTRINTTKSSWDIYLGQEKLVAVVPFSFLIVITH